MYLEMRISNQLILDLQIASKLARMNITLSSEDIMDPMFESTLDWLCCNLDVQVPENKHRQLRNDLNRLNETLIHYPEDRLAWIEQY